MSFSKLLVWSGISGRSSTISSSALLACRRASNRSSVAKPVRRLKIRSKRCLARLRWVAAIGFEVGIEPPYQAAHALLSSTMPVGEGVELVNQPLGMDPAQTVATDIELAGIVANDHGLLEEAMGLDAAPQCPFGGDQHRNVASARSPAPSQRA